MAYQQLLTDVGSDIIADSQAGEVLRFTKLVLGEGESTIEDVPAMTELVAPVMETGIASVVRDRLAQVTILTKIRIQDIPRSFALTEIGIFAQAGTGPEVLYGVCIAREHPEFLSPNMAGSSTAEHTIAIAVLIGATMEVEAIFDPDVQMVNIGPATVGAGLYSRRTGNTFEFKRVVAGGILQVAESTETVNITVPPIEIQTPRGSIVAFGGPNAPAGWLLCNGAAVSRATYAALFAIVGGYYGTGDGSTTFNVPDLRGRTLLGSGAGPGLTNRGFSERAGAETHVLTEAQLASHAHGVYDPSHNHSGYDSGHSHFLYDPGHAHSATHGGTSADATESYVFSGGGSPSWTLLWTQAVLTQASIAIGQAVLGIYHALTGLAIYATGGNQPHNNMQPYLAVSYIIKY